MQNRSWKDESYEYTKKKQDTIYITWNGKSQTIKEWSKELNIPYTTIDRRYRKNPPIDQVMSVEQLDKTKKVQSNKDKAAYELAKLIREDYKNGIIGKANYDKYNVIKSRYIDLIGNRTYKEDCVWWKN